MKQEKKDKIRKIRLVTIGIILFQSIIWIGFVLYWIEDYPFASIVFGIIGGTTANLLIYILSSIAIKEVKRE